MNDYNNWFDTLDKDFTNEVGPCLKTWMLKPMSIQELEEFDNIFIHKDLDTEVDI